MQEERSLSREIYDWRRLPEPTERFRRGERDAAAFNLENAIDHVKSSVDDLLGGWSEGRAWDYASLIESRMEAVRQAEEILRQSPLTAPEGVPYAAWLEATRSLLGHLAVNR